MEKISLDVRTKVKQVYANNTKVQNLKRYKRNMGNTIVIKNRRVFLTGKLSKHVEHVCATTSKDRTWNMKQK